MPENILQYESTIWNTADPLRGCGIKESEWPSYMMPFFIYRKYKAFYRKKVGDYFFCPGPTNGLFAPRIGALDATIALNRALCDVRSPTAL
jgi:hypothetical protein